MNSSKRAVRGERAIMPTEVQSTAAGPTLAALSGPLLSRAAQSMMMRTYSNELDSSLSAVGAEGPNNPQAHHCSDFLQHMGTPECFEVERARMRW